MKKWILGILVLAAMSWGLWQIDWAGSPRRECAFCAGEVLDAQTVFRGPLASLLVTYKPAVRGHVLIIPNRHVETYDALTPDEMAAMGELVKRMHLVSEKIFGAKDYLLLQKNGRSAGQTVPHVHIHFLPRQKSMGALFFLFRLFTAPLCKPISTEELKNLVDELM